MTQKNKKTTPINSKDNDIKNLKHQMEYLDFIQWIATPNTLREPRTQQELSKKFGVGQDTLSEWKNRSGFWANVKEKREDWGRDKTPNVIAALYNRIIKTGNASEIKLWLQYFEGWTEKTNLITSTKRKFEHLSNAELAEVITKTRNFLLKVD